MTKSAHFLFALIATALLSLQVIATPAAADPGDIRLIGPNVINYEVGYPRYTLDNARRLIRQGSPLALGGCQFRTAETRRPGVVPTTEIELAYDPDTCRLLVLIGTLATPRSFATTAGEAVEVTARPSASETTVLAQTPGFGSGPVPGAAYSANAFRAYLDQWYDEPARWIPGESVYAFLPPVNEQLNFVEWSPGSGCAVAPGTTGWLGDWQRWLVLTGWYQVSDVQTNSPSPIPCDQPILSRTQAHYQNRFFCAWLAEVVPIIGPALGPIVIQYFPTDVVYDPNHIQGNADGSYTVTMIKYKTGLCSDFLRGGQTDSYY